MQAGIFFYFLCKNWRWQWHFELSEGSLYLELKMHLILKFYGLDRHCTVLKYRAKP